MRRHRQKPKEEVKKLLLNGEIVWEYNGKRYPDRLRQGNACAAINPLAEKYCQGMGLDIGAGAYPFRDALPIRDLVNYTYSNGKQAKLANPRHGAMNAYNLDCFVDEKFDYVFSSHCLEHLDRPWDAMREWLRKIKKGGILFLYLPHPDMELWRMGGPWVRGAHKWIPTYQDVALRFVKNKIQILSGNEQRDSFWSFHIVGRKE